MVLVWAGLESQRTGLALLISLDSSFHFCDLEYFHRVHLLMRRKLPGLCKGCRTITNLTLKWFCARMNTEMFLQILVEREPLPTDIANKFSDGVVAACIVSFHRVQGHINVWASLLRTNPLSIWINNLFIHLIISFLYYLSLKFGCDTLGF